MPWFIEVPDTGRRRHRQRGAAYTEAVIMLPFFFIVFGLLLFVTRAYVSKSAVDSRARTCMWQHVFAGCGEPIPGCNIRDNPALVGAVPQQAASLLPTVSGHLAALNVDVDEIFGQWFAPFFDVDGESRVSRPTIMGGGRQRVATTLTSSCNERPRNLTIYEVGEIALCSHGGVNCP